jgi:acyl dehydratase
MTTLDETLKSVIGKPVSKSKVTVERGPVSNFAAAVCNTDPVYVDARVAQEAGLRAIPAPPTFPFVMSNWGEFPEYQPEDRPTGNPLGEVLEPLISRGGLILHGEQEFDYHRPVFVGDVLVGEGTIIDAYSKESKGRTMTFVVTETVWRDDATGEPVVSARLNFMHRI